VLNRTELAKKKKKTTELYYQGKIIYFGLSNSKTNGRNRISYLWKQYDHLVAAAEEEVERRRRKGTTLRYF
jgi:hypothetical protein